MFRRPLALTGIALAVFALAATAQNPPPVPPGGDMRSYGMPPDLPLSRLDFTKLSPEQQAELEKLKALVVPPGSSWSDFLEYWYTPRAYPKDQVVRVDETHALPHVAIAFQMEVVKEDGDTVWLRGLPPEDPRSPLHKVWLQIQSQEAFYMLGEELRDQRRSEYFFLDFEQPIVPPPSVDGLRFEPLPSGLPTAGRWQMNLVMADMNGDGHPDIVCPPERGGTARPTIFLGAGDGTFSFWREAMWSSKVPWDYGSIAVADFNRDGAMDVAIAVHFKAQHVLYGDGRGRFTEAVDLPSPDPRVSSRAITVGDFDGDGRPDLALLAEINYDQATSTRLETPTAWVVMNTESGWKLVTAGLPGSLIGNTVTTLDADRDGRLDLAFGSNSSNWRTLVYLNRGEEGWAAIADETGVLSNGYHFDVAVPRPGLREGSELYAVFTQFRMVEGQNQARTGVVRYDVTEKGVPEQGRVLVFDDKRNESYYRLGIGDLNGDGRADVVAGRQEGGLLAFVQTESGEFYLERGDELATTGRPFAIEVRDLDGDGLDDIVACFAQRENRPGGVSVWLSRPAS